MVDMYKGYRLVFWGVIVATILSPIGWMEATFSCIGMLIIAYGIQFLRQNFPEKSFDKAHLYCYLAAGWAVISEILVILSEHYMHSIRYLVPVILLLFAICEHTVVHHLLEASGDYLHHKNYPHLAKLNERDLKWYTILFISNTAIEIVGFTFEILVMEIIAVVCFVGIRIWLLVMVNRLKNANHSEEVLTEHDVLL